MLQASEGLAGSLVHIVLTLYSISHPLHICNQIEGLRVDLNGTLQIGVRADTWVETGTEVTPHYDSLLAKLMVHAPDRAGATAALQKALAATELGGIATNLDYVATIAGSQGFAAGAKTQDSANLYICSSSLFIYSPLSKLCRAFIVSNRLHA